MRPPVVKTIAAVSRCQLSTTCIEYGRWLEAVGKPMGLVGGWWYGDGGMTTPIRSSSRLFDRSNGTACQTNKRACLSLTMHTFPVCTRAVVWF
ncbi:hypothetical protein TESG_00033 [Trichophyton tonsurans CBS 112818]|uniref:Uncharacterized protein n=1 Tax=Trichophyton tonsurans (strain CBS 112818) TaxID=647933 RepID=F2RMA8_TRIT1|nr:hypothetical protein TESG_00033 [Trichophyton tonsurans CBS 112818]